MKELTLGILVKRFPKLSETFIYGEIANLIEDGWRLHILSLYRPNEVVLQPDAQGLISKVTYLDPLNPKKTITQLIKWILRKPFAGLRVLSDFIAGRVQLDQLAVLVSTVQRLEIDHIHAHYFSDPAVLAEHATSLTGNTFSISGHAKDIYLTPPDQISARLFRAQFVTTCTRHNVHYLQSHHPSYRQKINLIYHGIDSDYFQPPLSDKKLEDRALVVAIGRFKEKKGFDILIRACAKLLAKDAPLSCQIVGYGDQQDFLKSLIDELEIGNHVQLHPPVDHSNIKQLLQRASVFIMPCRITNDGDRDGIPNSLLEAMACGVPIITTSISGIPEVVKSGTNGLLVKPDDVDDLSGAIEEVLNNQELRTKLSRCGRETVTEYFNWKSNVGVLSDLLRSLEPRSPDGEAAR